MKLPRFIGLVDLAVLVVVIAAILLPPRPMEARDAAKGTDADRFALAHAEARMLAEPASGARVAELARRLGEAGFGDWAIETAVAGAERTRPSPDRWRALQAASVAYVDRRDVHPALDFIQQAASACESHPAACSPGDALRMDLYAQQLAGGVESGIDPRVDPIGFRKAGERKMRAVRLSPARGPR